MKRIIVASTLALVFSVAFGPVVNSEMAKEGTISGTLYYAGTHKVVPLDKERFVLVYDNKGVRVSDTGEGPFHNNSTWNVGVMYFEKGVGRLRGYVISTDPEGDKWIMEITETASQPSPKPTSGTGKIIGGTGKFEGIQGNTEYTRRSVRPSAKGTHQSFSKMKGTWKIVKPKQ
jgi:hypothetical protein